MKILIISDLHFPYAHKDSLPFLKTVKSWLKPDRVVNIGDEVDYHAISFHDKDPDLDNATQELLKARENIKKLEKLFPKMDLLHSNHGSLVFRKRKYHGLPDYIIKDYADILDVNKKNWKWHDKLILHDKYGSYYFVHNMKAPKRNSDYDWVFIEGQGSIINPGSTASLPLIRGSCITHMILCHRADFKTLRDYKHIKIPDINKIIKLYEDLAFACGSYPNAKV